ncbi:MAG: SpoIID/LytB domain-containing protein [bacterium]
MRTVEISSGGAVLRALVPCALLLTAVLSLAALSGCGAAAVRAQRPPGASEPVVRVLLDGSARETRLTSNVSLFARSLDFAEREFPNGVLVRSGASASGARTLNLVDLLSGEVVDAGDEVAVHAAGDGILDCAGRPYRGAIVVRLTRGGALQLVNALGMESYLLGVVAGEIGRLPLTRLEAVKAQAIAARTYALSSIGQYGASAGFDLYATVQDQVYEGVRSEDPTADAAIHETSGQVLDYRGKLARAYYHASCGGRTAPVDEVWTDISRTGYLRGTADRSMRLGGGYPLCGGGANFAWEETWDGRTLERILEKSLPRELGLPDGTDIGHVKGIKVLHRGVSGRVLDLEITTTTDTYRVRSDKVRSVLRRPGPGDPVLRSTLIRIEDVEKEAGRVSRLVVSGRGNGHGVGMCQLGAIGMAEAGASAREILAHYYPGARIRDLADVGGVPVPAATSLLAPPAAEIVERLIAWTGSPSSADPLARR